jgi:hypothetical protein
LVERQITLQKFGSGDDCRSFNRVLQQRTPECHHVLAGIGCVTSPDQEGNHHRPGYFLSSLG